jgi:membrane fusion protein
VTDSNNSNIYRREAVAHAGQPSFGGVMITQPLSLLAMTVILIVIALIVIGFLHYGEYARKVTVSGYLEPKTGISRVYPSKNGIAEKLLFSDGDIVEKGQPLLLVKAPYLLADGEEAHKKILSQLLAQRKGLNSGIDRQYEKNKLDSEWYRVQFLSLRKEKLQLEEIQKLQTESLVIISRQRQAIRDLEKNHFVSSFQMLQVESDYIEGQKKRVQLSQQLTRIEAEIASAEYQFDLLPTLFQEKMKNLQGELSAIERQITEVNGQSEYLVKAPVSGKVTAIGIRAGEAVFVERPILAILPENEMLVARLLIPSRAAGFVNDGQAVRLMYDSFPFQQFGTQSGRVISMTGAAIDSRDLNSFSRQSEPVFIAEVALDKNTITAFGKEQLLQADMLLTADIIQARRSILNWMLEPLYTLRGRT